VLRKQEAGLDRRLVQFRLKDPAPLMFHNEAVVRDGRIVGPVTSGNYGHFLGGAVGWAMCPAGGKRGGGSGLALRDRDCGGAA
jgi:glycine cleavage system aminomethyltransferase T